MFMSAMMAMMMSKKTLFLLKIFINYQLLKCYIIIYNIVILKIINIKYK